MRICRGLIISLTILACAITPGIIYALTALDFSKYLPDQVGDFNATSDAITKNLKKDNDIFHQFLRSYYNPKLKAYCTLQIIKGAGVPKTIVEQFSRGRKIYIENFKAVQIPPSNNSWATAHVQLGNDFLVTAVVFPTKDQDIPVFFLQKLNLKDLSTLGVTGVNHH